MRHGEAEDAGSLGVDDQLKLGLLHDRQVRGLRAFENAADIDAHLTIGIRQACSVAYQPTDFNRVTRWIYRGDFVECRQ